MHTLLSGMIVISGVSISAATPTQEPAPAATVEEGTSLTVYSSADPAGFDPRRFISNQRSGRTADYVWQVPGFGVVRETRTVKLEAGISELRFTDVAAFIDPTTVGFTDLTSGTTKVLEQNFEFDLVSPEKMLAKYVDQRISLEYRDRSWDGTLLSASGGQVVLRSEPSGSITILPMNNAVISMDQLPGGLITRPTLVWKIDSEDGGSRLVQTTYETAGLTWRADYNMVLGDGDRTADLTAWVSLMNLSGIGYENTRLKLVAGDVQRIKPAPQAMMMRDRSAPPTLGSRAESFEEESFFEYHLYTLPRRTDIASNGTQQLTLFNPIRDFPVQKRLVYGPAVSNWGTPRSPRTEPNWGGGVKGKVAVYVFFENDRKDGLGLPLPAGKVRVYKKNPNDSGIEFVGEDMIDHTPRNETVRLRLGESFDVLGERTRTDFTVDEDAKVMTESYSIEIRNQKDVPEQVLVVENMFRWRNWEVVQSTKRGTKVDASTMHWLLDVPAEGKRTLEYTVRYTW